MLGEGDLRSDVFVWESALTGDLPALRVSMGEPPVPPQ